MLLPNRSLIVQHTVEEGAVGSAGGGGEVEAMGEMAGFVSGRAGGFKSDRSCGVESSKAGGCEGGEAGGCEGGEAVGGGVSATAARLVSHGAV